MEPLLAQLRQLPVRLAAMPARVRLLAGLGAAAGVAMAVAAALATRAGDFQYAFTNLAPDDGAEAVALLKGAGIAARLEAGGTTLAVPGERVLDARLLLSGSGLPRSGGVGFELFDRNDFGVSEFTQKVNLRRALEGELARTIGRLSEVRSARVHVTLAEKGLFRDEDRTASAAVVLHLRPGRVPEPHTVAGIRHLVASAVAGLAAGQVTVVDARGAVLADDGDGTGDGFRRRLERELEQRVVGLLEPVAGPGAVVARVSVLADETEVSTNAEVFDPEATAVRSERRTAGAQSGDGATRPAGPPGGAALPDAAPAAVPSAGRGGSSTEEEQRSYEISRTVTTTVTKAPRVRRLSAAILVDGVDGRPRGDEEVARFAELARRALGFDAARGDQVAVTSALFARAEAPAEPPPAQVQPQLRWLVGAGAAAACVLVGLLLALRRPRASSSVVVEAAAGGPRGALAGTVPPPADPDAALRERARVLASAQPARAARLLRAWLAEPAPVPARSPDA